MIKINSSIFLFIFHFLYIHSSYLISFPIQFFYNGTLKHPNFIFLNNLFDTYLFSNIKIGQPQSNIKVLFSTDTYYFSIIPKLENILENNMSNYYQINKSETFQNISSLNKYYVLSKNDIRAKEKFIFNSLNLENMESNEIIINDLDFILGVKSKYIEINNTIDVFYLNVGLELIYSQKEKYNLISGKKFIYTLNCNI